MSEIWVVNASPVIALAKVDRLYLLSDLSAEVRVPEPVVQELLAGGSSDPALRAVESGWGRRLAATDVPRRIMEWELGAGESSVLAAALGTESSVAVLDDAKARRCARTFELRVVVQVSGHLEQ